MNARLQQKKEHLYSILKDMGGCVVGFSGGVDSTLLFAAAVDVLGPRALAVTVTSEIHPSRELGDAVSIARSLGGRHEVLEVTALDVPGLAENPENRCYICKQAIAAKLWEIAEKEGIPCVVDGSNVDDRSDYRPGKKAAVEANIRSPLDEAGLTKEDIRELSRMRGLPTWDKPSAACLTSRFPYGVKITPEKLAQVDLAENRLRDLGLRHLRVRHHGEVCRLELGPEEFRKVVEELREEVISLLKEIGFAYVALDLQGYRTGAMNEVLEKAS